MTNYFALYEYNAEAEQSVVGSMLIDSSCIGKVLSEVSQEDFSDDAQPAFRAISSLFAQQKKIDVVTVIAEAVRCGGDRQTLREYILQTADITPTASTVMEYVAILKESTRVRKMHAIAQKMMAAKSSDAVSSAMEDIAGILSGGKDERVKNSKELSRELFGWLIGAPETQFLKTSIPQLDRQLMLEPGMYMVIGGFPSDGKTMLAMQMALELSKKKKVGVFSYEGTTLQAVRRLYSAMGGISFSAIRRRKLAPQDKQDLDIVSRAFDALHLDIIQATGMKASDIRAMAAARGYDVVIIDYLQLVEPENWRDDETRSVTKTSKTIRAMTVDLGVLTIALSQFHRLGNGVRRAPTMSDLRQSGQIEQDANVILLLSEAGVETWEREDGYSDSAVPDFARARLLQIAKNREGERGGWMHMLMLGDLQRMEYWDPSADIAKK